MDEVQGVVPWHRFLLVMGVAEGSGDLRTNDTHPHGDQLIFPWVHGRTGYRAGAKAIGRGQFLLGHQSSRLATSTRPLPPTIVGTPPITTQAPSGLQTNTARRLHGGRGVRAAPIMRFLPLGAGTAGRSPANRASPLAGTRNRPPIPYGGADFIDTLALDRSVRAGCTRYRFRRESSRDAEWSLRYPVASATLSVLESAP